MARVKPTTPKTAPFESEKTTKKVKIHCIYPWIMVMSPAEPLKEKETQSKIPFKVTKPNTRKRRTAVGKKYLQALQRPTPPNRLYPVNINADGLVSMDPIPDYLVDAVNRNFNESPLLRLPEKIRKKIWAYAMGGMAIEMRLRPSDNNETDAKSDDTLTTKVDSATTFDQSKDQSKEVPPLAKSCPTASTPTLRTESPYYATIATPGPSRKKIRTAFHLPAVCRKIYLETATLTYSLNTFIFPGEIPSFGRQDGPDGALEGWATNRIPAQLKAITTIRPHWRDFGDYLEKNNMQAFRQYYPCLKRIVVAKRALSKVATWAQHGDPLRKIYRQRARREIAERVREQEGEHVEAVF
ncbi:hypothetical protein CC80DRAFT_540264 [Byssothecium circinans]|uniref:DUF7730 domain-containing protein n=1 Tax=Byssothecium circinans TaxID=147558 RepID=A0A6A5TKD4_9PLEO|nr:hypothetical protein CC80DRAFT_540264 [Byssothecium circinans]